MPIPGWSLRRRMAYPAPLMSDALNEQATREKSPDFATYGSAMSPSKTIGVMGVPRAPFDRIT